MLERFFALLESYERSGLPRPSLYPTEEGEARAEWSHRPWELSITALPDEPLFLLEALNLETDEWVEEEYTVSTSNELLDYLRPLLGVPDADR